MYLKNREEKLKTDVGGAPTYTEEEAVISWKAHDFDASGGVTKDELIWARKMKHAYFKQKQIDLDA